MFAFRMVNESTGGSRKKPGGSQGAEWATVSSGQAGQRVDNFLMARLKGVPRTRIYRMLRKGEVRINGGRCRPSQRLQAGDRVRIPPVATRTVGDRPEPPAGLRERVLAAILFEDSELAVLDKPAGLAVHAGSGTPHGLIEALQAARPQTEWSLAHRLDRGTSGCLVVGKGTGTNRKLQEAFRRNQVTKVYLALLVGEWSGGERLVKAPLRRGGAEGDRRKSLVDPEQGQEAVTRFLPVRALPGYTLVRAEPRTGRNHQIRVHARHLGFPLAGDELYGEEGANTELRARGLSRIFLHSAEVAFEHPISGERLHLQAPLPAELQGVLDTLAAGGEAVTPKPES